MVFSALEKLGFDNAPPMTLLDLQNLLVDVVSLQQRHDALLLSLSAKVETMECGVEAPINSKDAMQTRVHLESRGTGSPVSDGTTQDYHGVLTTVRTAMLNEFDILRQHQLKKMHSLEDDIAHMSRCLLSETDLIEQARVDHESLRQNFQALEERQQEQDRIVAQMCGLQSLARQYQSLCQMYACNAEASECKHDFFVADFEDLQGYESPTESVQHREPVHLEAVQKLLVLRDSELQLQQHDDALANVLEQANGMLEKLDTPAKKMHATGNDKDSELQPGDNLKQQVDTLGNVLERANDVLEKLDTPAKKMQGTGRNKANHSANASQASPCRSQPQVWKSLYKSN
jgi:chromosome segregation ATPase